MGGIGSGAQTRPRVLGLAELIAEEMDAALTASPTLKTLTERQQRFVVALAVQSVRNLGEAAQVAGYSDKDQQALWRKGSALARHPKIALACVEIARARLGSAAPFAAETLLKLADSPDEKIRLRATTEILSRVGVSGVQEVHVKTEDVTKPVPISKEAAEEFLARAAALGLIGIAPLAISPPEPAGPVEDADFVEVERSRGRDAPQPSRTQTPTEVGLP
jgi:phage terminase small subunit